MQRSASSLFLRINFYLFLIPLLTAGLLAQSSGLSGIVTDSSGRVMPGVEVTLTNPETAASRTVITDEVGRYVFDQVTPGSYELRGSLPGFKTSVVTDLALQVDVSPCGCVAQMKASQSFQLESYTTPGLAALFGFTCPAPWRKISTGLVLGAGVPPSSTS